MAYKINSTFNVPAVILKSETKKVNGINTKKFTEVGNIFCSFKTYGGTERELNDILVVENTAVIETFFRTDITNDCQIKLTDGSVWEILNVENIEMRNMYLRIKVKNLKGNA